MSTQDSELDRAAKRLVGRINHMLKTIDREEKHPSAPYGEKRCSSCKKVKSINSFYRFHRSRDGRLGRCKSCFLEKRKEAE